MFRSVTNQGGWDSTTAVGSVAIASTGNITLISSGTGPINVYAYSIAANSTIANAGQTMRLVSGSTTASCWTITLAGPSSGATGLSEAAVSPPAYLFRTSPGDALTYEKGASSVTGAIASYSFSYWRG